MNTSPHGIQQTHSQPHTGEHSALWCNAHVCVCEDRVRVMTFERDDPFATHVHIHTQTRVCVCMCVVCGGMSLTHVFIQFYRSDAFKRSVRVALCVCVCDDTIH